MSLSWTAFVECKMEPFVVGGKDADIENFPHSVFLYVSCYFDEKNNSSIEWVCGGSIVSDQIILTAAHCVYGCTQRSVYTVTMGHAHKKNGFQSTIQEYIIHQKYIGTAQAFDIAIARPKTPLKFDMNVKRIALMKDPPYYDKAQIAGWGMIDVSTFCLLVMNPNITFYYIIVNMAPHEQYSLTNASSLLYRLQQLKP